MSAERRSFASYSDFAGFDGAKDLSHQSGEYKPEQVVEGVSAELDMAIMSVAIQEGLYSDEDVSILCPGCYEELDGWHDGLPSPLLYYERPRCDSCEEKLYRHELVVTPSSKVGTHDPEKVREFVVGFFRAYQFFGPSRDAHIFRNWEHQDRWNDMAEAWDLTPSQRPECPVCGKLGMSGRWDTDHHDRSTDRVLCLCRDCHHYGHNTQSSGAVDGGSNMPGDVQDAKAQRYGMRNGTDIKLARYAIRYQKKHSDEDLQERYERDGGKWRHIAKRINAYSWSYGVDLDTRATELEAIVGIYEKLLAQEGTSFLEQNDGYPEW